jgi:arylsulfatase A-like enzyme
MHHQNPVYAGMIKSVDQSVGRVLARLKERGLDQNTIVVFASDNGGFVGIDKRAGQTVPATDNSPLRSGKGSCYEGGIRVPLIVRWPGVTGKNGQCDEAVVVMDMYPTLLKAAGVDFSDDVKIDGVDLTPLLADPTVKLDRAALFFHYPHYYSTTTPVGAVRAGDWKLLEYFEDNRIELYDLKNDLAETTDLAKKLPEKAAKLRQRLHRWRTETGAAMPSPNPDFQRKTTGPSVSK